MQSKYLTFIFGVVLLILIAGCQLGTIGVSNNNATPTPGADGPRAIVQSTTTGATVEGDTVSGHVTATALAGASTPEPATTALPDRTTCAEIQGTDYRSTSEREWYLANCVPTPEPAAPQPAPPAIPGPEVEGERWILVDIGTQTTSAMIGDTALYTAYVTTGVDGWNTPTGTWNIVYRVENETMTSTSIGAEEHYVLEDVLYTQYFTTVGHALHLNYWRDDSYFGSTRSSHGCVGMRLADAEFFWNFAGYGTRVTIQ